MPFYGKMRHGCVMRQARGDVFFLYDWPTRSASHLAFAINVAAPDTVSDADGHNMFRK
jgi:hypothetical protein